MGIVGCDCHHALLVDHDAVALAKAAAIKLWVGHVLDFLVANVENLLIVSDHLLGCRDVVVCCSLHNLAPLIGCRPVLDCYYFVCYMVGGFLPCKRPEAEQPRPLVV